MPEVKSDIGAIAKAIQSGLDLWKTFIATRQEAYNRKMDQRLRQAVDCGEKGFLLFKDYKAAKDEKDKNRINSKIAYWERKFFKLNQ